MHLKILNDLQRKYSGMYTQDMWDNAYNLLSPGAKRVADSVSINKKGGTMRSAADQIRIDTHKAFNKTWTENNKEVQKAISKMSDRVHDLIMKMIS
jgi:hypothetical protein